MAAPLYAQKNLRTQGFTCQEVGFEEFSPWLRLNPSICLVIAVIALATGSASLFFVLAALGGLGVLLPNSLGDILYNTFIRHITNTPKIPRTPAPRRFACFVAMVAGIATGLLFFYGYTMLASLVGLALILAIIPMVALHYCIASVIYQAVKK